MGMRVKRTSKVLSVFLVVASLFGVIAFLPVKAYVAPYYHKPTDMPSIYIYTDSQINRDAYVYCKIVAVDRTEGQFATVDDTNATVKVRGNSTSSGEKKPYNFKFNAKTDLFGLGKAKKWCLLANHYDKTLMRNKLVFDFSEKIGMEFVSDSMFVDVYLNGTYLGNYLLTEAVEIGSTRVDIEPDDNEVLFEIEPWEGYSNPLSYRTPRYGILLGYNDPEDPAAGLQSYVNTFFTNAENALASKNKTNISKYFDLQSFIDTYIVQEYFKNVDFNTSSTRYYIKDGHLYAGPVWDFDLSSGNCSSTYYTTYNNVKTTGKSYEGIWCNAQWYKVLLTCTWFTDMLKARYLEIQDEIINTYQDNIIGKNRIDFLISENKNSFDRNYALAGWSISRVYSDLERIPDSTYQANVEYLRTWLKNRNAWLLKQWDIEGCNLTVKSNSPYRLDGMFITNVPTNTYVAEFLSMMKSGSTVVRDGMPSTSSIVRTGDAVTLGGPSYQIAVTGDTSGDGKLGVIDYIQLRLHILGIAELQGAYKLAADYNHDGKVAVMDYIGLRLKLLGID